MFSLKDISFLGERRFDSFGRRSHCRAGTMSLGELEVAWKVVDHRAEDDVQRLLLVVHIEQVMYVRDADLGGETRVNGAALCSFLVEAFIRVIGINEVFRGNPQRLEVGAEDGVHGVHVENARNPDAKVLALFHQLEALLLLWSDRDLGQRIGNNRRRVRFEGSFCAGFRHVGVVLLGGIQTLFDLAHVVNVFDKALLAAIPDNQALDSWKDGNLRLFPGLVRTGDLNVDKRPHALVLAEVAAGVLIAMGDVGDLLHRLEADKARPAPLLRRAFAPQSLRRWPLPPRNVRGQ